MPHVLVARHTPTVVTAVTHAQETVASRTMQLITGLVKVVTDICLHITLPILGKWVSAIGQRLHQGLEELAVHHHASHQLQVALDLRPIV